MSYGDDGAVLEGRPDRLLDELVGLQIHSRRRLVQHQNLGFPQQGPRETDKLPLSNAGDPVENLLGNILNITTQVVMVYGHFVLVCLLFVTYKINIDSW